MVEHLRLVNVYGITGLCWSSPVLRPLFEYHILKVSLDAVGILAAHCAFFRGAARVVIIDEQKFGLDFAKKKVPGLETINFKEVNTLKELRAKFPHGPDVALEAVGVHYVEVSG